MNATMLVKRIGVRRVAVFSSLAILVLTGSTAAIAAQTSAPTVAIRGCYLPGAASYVRILTPAQHCRAGETAIQWNQTGPEGDCSVTLGSRCAVDFSAQFPRITAVYSK